MNLTPSRTVAEEYADTLRDITRAFPPTWRTIDWSQGPLAWRLFRPCDATLPDQGWKIHVSAAAVEASALCSVIAPVLCDLGAAFKLPRRLEDVLFINSGDGGAELLGKVVTIYPRDDEHARAIALRADALWPVGRGPEVQTDLHLRPGSAVSLRYGVFGSAPTVTNSSGVHEFAISMPDGTLVPDARRLDGKRTPGTPEPPLQCCPPRPWPVQLRQILTVNGRRYMPLTVLSDKPTAKIFLSVDLGSLITVIVKVGRPGVAGDEHGADIGVRLKMEFDILTALSDQPGLAPVPIAWSDDGWPISVLEDVRGELLSDLSRDQRIDSLRPLAMTIASLHHAGYVHGDIKLENAIRRGERVTLIDFELACREGEVIGRGGTRGYLAPEAVRGATAAFARDVFAFGGCVAQAVLGVPPGLLPEGVGRVRGLLRLEGAAGASRLLADLVTVDPAARPSAAAAAGAIADHRTNLRRVGTGAAEPSTRRELDWCVRASVQAALLVARYAEEAAAGRCWRNEHSMSAFRCEGVNVGAAGIILGLASIDQALGRSGFVDAVREGARWLAAGTPKDKAAGLFSGNAGVAVALAVAGRRLADDRSIRAALARLEAAAHDARELDLFSGSAGVVLASCIVCDVLGHDAPLELGLAAVRSLARRRHVEQNIPLWSIDPASDTHYLGCAHGSAGIALAHAMWGHRAGDRTSVDTARDTFRQLFANGRTADGSALRMTLRADRSHAAGNWCHGVAGYLWCMLYAFGDDPALRNEIDWAVGIVADAAAAATPTYCHGLAGRLELWRMLAEVPRYQPLAAAQAGKMARALRLLHHKVDGHVAWCSDDPTVTTPDLWIGFLGPATALALHVAGSTAPLLSGRWLAPCASARHA